MVTINPCEGSSSAALSLSVPSYQVPPSLLLLLLRIPSVYFDTCHLSLELPEGRHSKPDDLQVLVLFLACSTHPMAVCAVFVVALLTE